MNHHPSILMVTPRYLPAVGGVERHIETISKRLLKRRFSVTVLTVSHSYDLKSSESIDGIKILRMPFRYSRHPILGWLWVFQKRRQLVKHDIIHVHDTLPLLFWWLPLRLLYPLKRVSVTFHGFERDPIPHHFVLLRRLANRVASRTLCIGRFIQTQYGIKCGKISVGAVTPSKSSNPSPEDSALFVGRLEEDTGILDYVETIHILKEKYNIDIPLRILGEGRLADEIKQRARESKVTIELLGVVDNPEYYIERARFCFAAGYLSILEALALSVPVIGLAKTSLKHEYLLSMKEAGAPISIQQSSSLIADEVVRLLSDNELYSRIQSTGRAFALKMNWEKLEIIYLKMWSN